MNPSINTADVILIKNGGPISAAAILAQSVSKHVPVTEHKFSHIAISSEDALFVEATLKGGTKYTPIHELLPKDLNFDNIKVFRHQSCIDQDNVLKRLKTHIGKQYSVDYWSDEAISGQDALYCSQYVGQILEEEGLITLARKNSTPNELFLAMNDQSSGWLDVTNQYELLFTDDQYKQQREMYIKEGDYLKEMRLRLYLTDAMQQMYAALFTPNESDLSDHQPPSSLLKAAKPKGRPATVVYAFLHAWLHLKKLPNIIEETNNEALKEIYNRLFDYTKSLEEFHYLYVIEPAIKDIKALALKVQQQETKVSLISPERDVLSNKVSLLISYIEFAIAETGNNKHKEIYSKCLHTIKPIALML